MADGKKASSRKIKKEIRREMALELRKGGASYRDISRTLIENVGFEELGVKKYSHVTAFRDVQSALEELQEKTLEKADQVRTLQMERLMDLLESVWDNALAGEISAVKTALQVMQQINSLHGFDQQTIDIQSRGEPIQIGVKEVIVEIPQSAVSNDDTSSG